MENDIKITEDEIKDIGAKRWTKKNGRRYFGIMAGVLLVYYAVIMLLDRIPGMAILVAIILGGGLIYLWFAWIMKPMRKAGEEFLIKYKKEH